MKNRILIIILVLSIFLIGGCSEISIKENILKTPTEKLKSRLEDEGYKIYLIKEGINNKGDYVNIIYEYTSMTNDSIDKIKLREFAFNYFPDKDYYVTSWISIAGWSTYLITDKIVTNYIYFETFEDRIDGWFGETSVIDGVPIPRDTLEVQLSDEEFYLLEFRYKDEMETKLRNNENCLDMAIERYDLTDDDRVELDELLFLELFKRLGASERDGSPIDTEYISDNIKEALDYEMECVKMSDYLSKTQ